MQYLRVIKTAVMVFPFLALIIAFPFLVFHYRKYGSISFFRSIIVFSLFFYLLCCYFLVILPLPSRSSVAKYTSIYYNLKPFYFVPDFISSDAFNPKDFSTYFLIFKQFKYLEPIFNILMVIPFGVYMRYYFKCSFFKTLFLSFCLSLLFELTQLTGLFFIYPRPYRLFDVNDLINNSLGGIIGYFVCPLLSFFLPTRDSLDENDYIRGTYVSIGRRFVALLVDYFLIILLSIGVGYVVHFRHFKIIYLVINSIYFVFIPFFSQGFTFGKWLLRFKNVGGDIDGHIGFFSNLFKWIILHLIILNGWLFLFVYYKRISHNIYYVIVFYCCAYTVFLLHSLFSWIVKKGLFYDTMLKLDSVSIIDTDDDYETI